METNKESTEKKEMMGKAAAAVAGVTAFAGATAVGIDVLGEESGDELVAVNPVQEGGGADAEPSELLAYEQAASVEEMAGSELEIIEDSQDLPSAEVEVHMAGDVGSQAYLADADVHIDASMDDLLASADVSDAGFIDGVIDVVNDLV